MGVMMTWLEKTLEVSPSHVAPIESISASRTLQAEKNTDNAGTNTKNLRGYDPRQFSCQFRATANAGTPDVVGEYRSWEELVGMYAPLYINGQTFGGKRYILNSVSVSDVMVAPTGVWLTAVIKLDFEEYEGEKSADKGTVTNVALSKALGLSQTANKKNTAVQIKPSTYDKATRK